MGRRDEENRESALLTKNKILETPSILLDERQSECSCSCTPQASSDMINIAVINNILQ